MLKFLRVQKDPERITSTLVEETMECERQMTEAYLTPSQEKWEKNREKQKMYDK